MASTSSTTAGDVYLYAPSIALDDLSTSFFSPFAKEHSYGDGYRLRTVVEQNIVRISAVIRNKPEWEKKHTDPVIRKKWIAEAKKQRVTTATIEYALDELLYYLSLRRILDDGAVMEMSVVDGVWQLDAGITGELLSSLRTQVAALETDCAGDPDWHPNSAEMVLDLIHPSLFCVIANRTLVVDDEVITIDNALRLMGKGSLIDTEEFRRRYEHIPAITVRDDRGQPEASEDEDDDNDNTNEDETTHDTKNNNDNIDTRSTKRARIENISTPQTNTVHILLRTTDETPQYIYIMYGELSQSTSIEEVKRYISSGIFMCNNPHVSVRDEVIHNYYHQDYARNIPVERIILRSQYHQRLRHNKTLADYDYINGSLITIIFEKLDKRKKNIDDNTSNIIFTPIEKDDHLILNEKNYRLDVDLDHTLIKSIEDLFFYQIYKSSNNNNYSAKWDDNYQLQCLDPKDNKTILDPFKTFTQHQILPDSIIPIRLETLPIGSRVFDTFMLHISPNIIILKEVHRTDTILAIKKRIAASKGEKPPQALSLNGLSVRDMVLLAPFGTVLSNEHTLEYYGLASSRTLTSIELRRLDRDALPAPVMTPLIIAIDLVSMHSRKRNSLDVFPDTTIGAMKTRIAEYERTAIDLMIARPTAESTVEFADDQTVASCGLTEGASLFIDCTLSDVLVTVMSDTPVSRKYSAFVLICHPKSTIAQLKVRIAHREHVSPDLIYLRCNTNGIADRPVDILMDEAIGFAHEFEVALRKTPRIQATDDDPTNDPQCETITLRFHIPPRNRWQSEIQCKWRGLKSEYVYSLLREAMNNDGQTPQLSYNGIIITNDKPIGDFHIPNDSLLEFVYIPTSDYISDADDADDEKVNAFGDTRDQARIAFRDRHGGGFVEMRTESVRLAFAISLRKRAFDDDIMNEDNDDGHDDDGEEGENEANDMDDVEPPVDDVEDATDVNMSDGDEKKKTANDQDDDEEEEEMDDEDEADDDEAVDDDAPDVAGDGDDDEDDDTEVEKPDIDYTLSAKFAWLPTDVTVNVDGTVSIDSYINNLHPKRHRDLYGVLERIFVRFVPLFNRVLTDLRHPRDARVIPSNWWGPELEVDEADDDDAMQDSFERRGFIAPDAPTFFTPELPASIVDLRGHKLQVIVKLANIVLTPDKPKYDGGVWHVEGMKNEDIVSTGIFYYDNENIDECHLEFRRATTEPLYEQNDELGVPRVYGLENEGELVQDLGAVNTSSGRCICFPNIYQHRVSPFKLINPALPGHRKIVVFFLIDPTVRILSTSNVPPQRADWFLEESNQYRTDVLLDQPIEIQQIINEYLLWPITLNEAKVYRNELMKERKYFIKKNTDVVFERPFSLCEH